MRSFFKWGFIFFFLLLFVFLALLYSITYHPKDIEPVEFSGKGGPVLRAGQSLKVLSWNVQYMASKNYVFYYDLPDFSGPDERPSLEHVSWTLDQVARVIRDEDPDVILLQEIDVGSKRTDGEDQIELLRRKISLEYIYEASAYYHKADYVPHPRIAGSVGLKLVTFSKYKIKSANRYQLALLPKDFITQMFYLKRCYLETILAVDGAADLYLINTHLDAFAHGTGVLGKQIGQIKRYLDGLDRDNLAWIIGGDFNLLPPGQRSFLTESVRQNYQEKTELLGLLEKWDCIPSSKDCIGSQPNRFYTHFPNDPSILRPDRTIDYIFYANNVGLKSGYIRQKDTMDISDHLPLVGEFQLP